MSAFGRGPRGYGYGVNISDEALRTLGAQLGRREQSDKGLGLALSIGEGHDFRQDDAARIHREVEQQAEQRRRVLEHLVQQQRDAEARNFQVSHWKQQEGMAAERAKEAEARQVEREKWGSGEADKRQAASDARHIAAAVAAEEKRAANEEARRVAAETSATNADERSTGFEQMRRERNEADLMKYRQDRGRVSVPMEAEGILAKQVAREPSAAADRRREAAIRDTMGANRFGLASNAAERAATKFEERTTPEEKAADRAESQRLKQENEAWQRYKDLANDFQNPEPDVEQRWAKAFPGKVYPPTGELPKPPKPPEKSWWDRHFGSGGSGGPGMPGAQGGAGSFGARTLKPPYGEGNQEAEAAMARSAQTGPGPTASPFERAADAATARSEAPARFAQVRTFPPNPAGQADQERLAALRVRARPAGASLFGRQAAYTGIPSAYDTAPNGPISIGMPRREAVAYAQAEGGQKRDMTDVTIGVLLRLTPKDRFDKIMELRKTPEEALRRGINVEEVLAAMAGSAA